MPSLSHFDVRGRPGNLHSPTPRLPLYWLKQRRIGLPTEGSVELCCNVRVALLSAHQMKQHTCSRVENAHVVCAKEVWACVFNLLTPNDHYSRRTAPLTSKRCILCIYSTNTGTEYFKHGINSPFLSLQNAACFIILTNLVPVLFTFYIQDVLNLKKIIPAP